MVELARPARRVPALARAALWLGASWAAAVWAIDALFNALLSPIGPLLANNPKRWDILDALVDGVAILRADAVLAVFVATLAVPLAMLARTVVRARVRAGLSDPLDRARAWLGAHPRTARALASIPALVWVAIVTWDFARQAGYWVGQEFFEAHAAGTWWTLLVRHAYVRWMGAECLAVAAWYFGVAGLSARGLAALVAPTLAATTEPAPDDEDRVAFDAIAVTRETRAAVAAMAALPLLTVAVIVAGHLGDRATQAALAAYVAVALGGTLAFRRMSRIAVGVDGVFVTGTSRARFYAYRELTRARAKGSDIELVAGDRVALRLQLHGEDATHKDRIAARIQAAIDTALRAESAAAGQVVTSVPDAELERIVRGADYRVPALTREQLWSLVEGPEHGASARTAAARALAKTGDGVERRRLRVAAERCAEPRVRVALLELVDDEATDVPPEETSRALSREEGGRRAASPRA